MWVVLLVFFLALLLVAFLLYGLQRWDTLLTDDDPTNEATNAPGNDPTNEVDGAGGQLSSGRLFPLWLLLLGLGGYSVLATIVDWWSPGSLP